MSRSRCGRLARASSRSESINQPARCGSRRIGVVGVSSRRRSRASLAACLALALLSVDGRRGPGGTRRASSRPGTSVGAGRRAGDARPRGAARHRLSSSGRLPAARRARRRRPPRRRGRRPGTGSASRPAQRPHGLGAAASVDRKPVRKEIVIDRSERTLELRDGGRRCCHPGRGRRLRDGDAARPLLRDREVP